MTSARRLSQVSQQLPFLSFYQPILRNAQNVITRKHVKEGGIGSIMRDPDLDSAAREEAPKTYKMVYSRNKWRTVDKVPSDISFQIPSESM
ncbi:hypothetical protein RB195_001624 [Necator americanus]|uniref:Uncharacterized protein n=1 Tax=Necator americanus TaxID=51031 RepID=A0ABR1DG31_NECAM